MPLGRFSGAFQDPRARPGGESGGIRTMWGPQTIAKLVNITPMSLWFIVFITIVFMGFINQLITGGPHIVWIIYIYISYVYLWDDIYHWEK